MQHLNKKIDINYYDFDHEKVNEKFPGGMTYLCTIPVYDIDAPSAIYECANPDKKKGHQKYMLITNGATSFFVSGMDEEKIQKYKNIDVLHCKLCLAHIYSLYRHDYRHCSCGKCSIDGGRDYTKVGGDPADYEILKYDAIARKFLNQV